MVLILLKKNLVTWELQHNTKGGRNIPPDTYLIIKWNSSYNLYFTNCKTLYLQWFFFWVENIRTFHIYKYEHFTTWHGKRGAKWLIKRQGL